jgi:hypothetical protein
MVIQQTGPGTSGDDQIDTPLRAVLKLWPLTCGDVEPEVGFGPTTFRLRGGIFQSDTGEGDGFWLVRMAVPSVWSDRGRSSRIVGMTMGMTTARSISHRVRGGTTTLDPCSGSGSARSTCTSTVDR